MQIVAIAQRTRCKTDRRQIPNSWMATSLLNS